MIWPGYSSSFSISRAISCASSDGAVVVDRARRDDHADLAAGLHGVDLVDAVVAGGDLLEVAQALDVLLQRLAAGAGPGAESASAAWTITASTVCGSTSLWWASIAWATASDSPWRRARSPPTSACGPSISCETALPMSCSSAARRAVFGLRAELVGHHRRELRALDGVGEHVLAVARAELQPAQHLDQLGVEALDVGVEDGLLPGLDDVRLELGLGLVVGLLDARRVDAPVLQQLLERHARDLAPDAVEARSARPRWACRR